MRLETPNTSPVSDTARRLPRQKRHLRRHAAADYCGVSNRFLENEALRGTGPKFIRLSRRLVVYDQDDLDQWLAQRAVTSTSEGAN